MNNDVVFQKKRKKNTDFKGPIAKKYCPTLQKGWRLSNQDFTSLNSQNSAQNNLNRSSALIFLLVDPPPILYSDLQFFNSVQRFTWGLRRIKTWSLPWPGGGQEGLEDDDVQLSQLEQDHQFDMFGDSDGEDEVESVVSKNIRWKVLSVKTSSVPHWPIIQCAAWRASPPPSPCLSWTWGPRPWRSSATSLSTVTRRWS